jgi:hypothetical protein
MVGVLNLVYKGESSNDIYIASFDGNTWSGNEHIDVQNAVLNTIQSNYGPTAIDYAGTPYLIYKGAHSNEVYQSHRDPIWQGNTPIVVKDPDPRDPNLVSIIKSNYNPGAAAFRNRLFIAYKTDISNDLAVSFMNSGGDWHENALIRNMNGGASLTPGGIAPKSNYDPSVANLNDTLYLIYKGESSNTLYTTKFDGAIWTGDEKISDQPPKTIAPESNYTPAAVTFNGRLYLIYKGAHSNALYYASFDGTTWHDNMVIDIQGVEAPKSDQTPGAAVFNNRLYIAYKSQSSNDLFTAWFDGKSWAGNTSIASQKGGISPKSNYGPGMFVSAG